jgi:predicted dehydrogenase
MTEKTLEKQYDAVIIGLGKIGQGFDYERNDDGVITTHASAYVHHPGYELIAGVDLDPLQRKRFEDKFHRPAYPDLLSLMERHNPEVFSIATPVESHLSVLLDIMQCTPTAIICEKPIAMTAVDGYRMRSLAKDRRCALIVNYMRRFEPGSMEVKRILGTRGMGGIFKGVSWYSKGLLNNGSHFIDLLRFWLGDVTGVEIMSRGRRWGGLDPEPDICLYFHETPVYLLAGREELFSIGKIELFCSSGVISYTDFGNFIDIRRTCPSPFFEGYMILGPDREVVNTDLKRYQLHVLEGLYRHLSMGEDLNSDGRSATETLEVIERVCDQLDRSA